MKIFYTCRDGSKQLFYFGLTLTDCDKILSDRNFSSLDIITDGVLQKKEEFELILTFQIYEKFRCEILSLVSLTVKLTIRNLENFVHCNIIISLYLFSLSCILD